MQNPVVSVFSKGKSPIKEETFWNLLGIFLQNEGKFIRISETELPVSTILVFQAGDVGILVSKSNGMCFLLLQLLRAIRKQF